MQRSFPAALLLLLAACGGTSPDPRSRDPYARYLGVRELGDQRDAASVAQIVALLEDPHPLVAAGALDALAEIGDPAFLQHAVPKLKHPEPLVRTAACAAVGALKNPEGIAGLVETLKDPDPFVRRAAIKALRGFGKRPEAFGALVEAVADPDPGVSTVAHETLASITGRRDIPRSRDAWSHVAP